MIIQLNVLAIVSIKIFQNTLILLFFLVSKDIKRKKE